MALALASASCGWPSQCNTGRVPIGRQHLVGAQGRAGGLVAPEQQREKPQRDGNEPDVERGRDEGEQAFWLPRADDDARKTEMDERPRGRHQVLERKRPDHRLAPHPPLCGRQQANTAEAAVTRPITHSCQRLSRCAWPTGSTST